MYFIYRNHHYMYFLFIIILSFFPLKLLWAENKTDFAIAQAEYLSAVKQYQQAIQSLEQTIAQTTNNEDSLRLLEKLGAIAEINEDYNTAESAYQRIYSQHPTLDSAESLIHVSLMSDNLALSQDLLDIWLKNHHDHAKLLYYQGLLFCYQLQFDKAQSVLEKSLQSDSPIKNHAQRLLDEIRKEQAQFASSNILSNDILQKQQKSWDFDFQFLSAFQIDSNTAMIPSTLIDFYETNTSSTATGYRMVLQFSSDISYRINSHFQWYFDPSMYLAIHVNERDALSQFDIYSPAFSTGILLKKNNWNFDMSLHYRDIFTHSLDEHFSNETGVNLLAKRQFSQKFSLDSLFEISQRNFFDLDSQTSNNNNQDALAVSISLSPTISWQKLFSSFNFGIELNQADGKNYQYLSYFSHPYSQIIFNNYLSSFVGINLSYKHYYHYISDEQIDTRKDLFMGIQTGIDYQLSELSLITVSYSFQKNEDIVIKESPYAYERHLAHLSFEYRY